MLEDIQDEEYQTQSHTLKLQNEKVQLKKNFETVNNMTRYCLMAVSGIFTFLYIVAMYFTYWDDAKGWDRMFSNVRKEYSKNKKVNNSSSKTRID